MALAAHPQPLTQRNDHMYIDDEVMQNSSHHALHKHQANSALDTEYSKTTPTLEVEEQPTMLYDILETINSP